MLPIKAIDTVQPFWLVIDLVFHPFSLRQYRSGSATPTARALSPPLRQPSWIRSHSAAVAVRRDAGLVRVPRGAASSGTASTGSA